MTPFQIWELHCRCYMPLPLYDCWTNCWTNCLCDSCTMWTLYVRQLDRHFVQRSAVAWHHATVAQTVGQTAARSVHTVRRFVKIVQQIEQQTDDPKTDDPTDDSMQRRTACRTWKTRGNGGFHNQSNFDLKFEAYHIIIAARVHSRCTAVRSEQKSGT